MARDPVVGVFGGGDVPRGVRAQARELGAAIARRGWVLLNGGRDAGVMRASAEGAREEGGLVVGVLPTRGPGDGQADVAPGVSVAVFTDLGEARNNVNVLSCDAAVALPGGVGTLSEAALAAKHGTPLVLLGWEEVPAAIREHASSASSLEEGLDELEASIGT